MKHNILTAVMCILPMGLTMAQSSTPAIKLANTKLEKVNLYESVRSQKSANPQANNLTPFQKQLQTLLKGSEGVGGGHEAGLAFRADLESAIKGLDDSELAKAGKTREELQNQLDKIKVIVVDQDLALTFKGYIQNSVAVNIPAEKMIVVNKVRWDEITDRVHREGIALHEYLSLFEFESTGYYPVSAKYVARKGLSEKKLAKSLAVNRLEQIKTSTNETNAFEILKEYFKEAKEPISWADLSEKQSQLNYVCVSSEQSFWADTWKTIPDKENQFINNQFSLSSVVVQKEVQGQGPLFPAKPALKENRFYISKYLELIPEGLKNSWLEVSEFEIKQHNPGLSLNYAVTSFKTDQHFQAFRKNNGLLTYTSAYLMKVDGRTASFIYYGYCYTDK